MEQKRQRFNSEMQYSDYKLLHPRFTPILKPKKAENLDEIPLLILPPQIQIMGEISDEQTILIHQNRLDKKQRRYTESFGEKQIFNLLNRNFKK